MWHQTRMNIKNLSNWNFDYMHTGGGDSLWNQPFHTFQTSVAMTWPWMRSYGILPSITCILVEETAFEISHFTHFRPQWPWLDLGWGHTAYCRLLHAYWWRRQPLKSAISHISDLNGHDLTLDRVIRQTAYCRQLLIDLYLHSKFCSNWKNFLTMDGHWDQIHCSRPKIITDKQTCIGFVTLIRTV